MQVIVIDPRRTATCDLADLHLSLAPGTDDIIFTGLFKWLSDNGYGDDQFVANHTDGFQATRDVIDGMTGSISEIANKCDLSASSVEKFFRLFGETPKTVTLFSQGINQSSNGSDKGNAIINCHLLTGRIGRPGMGPFSMTGQPNAMGGRETGGLANQLAAHMDLENSEHRELVQQFWQSPGLPARSGLKAVDLFEAVHGGQIKAIWIMATNPVVSMPDAERVKAALKKCDLVVVSDVTANTDTTEFADVLFPAQAWGEKDGTVTNSERRISRQRSFLPAPGEARPDWWIICEIAKKMGHGEAFDFASSGDIFCEHAALSGFENNGTRDFDISALSELNSQEYENLTPVQWPVTPGNESGTPRLCKDGRFFHKSRRARFVPPSTASNPKTDNITWPLSLNTGRLRDHWHTMTRTGKSARLSTHTVEPVLDIHPDDAQIAGVEDGSLANLVSASGDMPVRVRFSADQKPGTVFLPIHWNGQFASHGRVGTLIPAVCDPHSGQPEYKNTPVRLLPAKFQWHAFALSRHPLAVQNAFPGADYYVCAKGPGYYRYELSWTDKPASWTALGRKLADHCGDGLEQIEYSNTASGQFRYACLQGGKLQACLFVSSDHNLSTRAWLAGLFGDQVPDNARASLLAGKPGKDVPDTGPVVCACFAVGLNAVQETLRSGIATSVEDIGNLLKAGTNCGSCKPELARIIEDMGVPA